MQRRSILTLTTLAALCLLVVSVRPDAARAEGVPRAGDDGSLRLESARHARTRARLEPDGRFRVCDERYRLCVLLDPAAADYHVDLDLAARPGEPAGDPERALAWAVGPGDGRALFYEDGAPCAEPDACEPDDALIVLVTGGGALLGGATWEGRGALSVEDLVAFDAEAGRPATLWVERGEVCGCRCVKREWQAFALLPTASPPRGRPAAQPWRLASVLTPQLTGDVEMALDCYPGDPDTTRDDHYKICIMERRGRPLGLNDGRFSLPSRVRYSSERALWLTLGWDAARGALVVEARDSGVAPAYQERCDRVHRPCPCGEMTPGEVVRW